MTFYIKEKRFKINAIVGFPVMKELGSISLFKDKLRVNKPNDDRNYKSNMAIDLVAKEIKLKWPGLDVRELDFYLNDYELLSELYGVKIDFDESFIEIFEPGTIAYPAGGYLLHPIIKPLPIQTLTLKDFREINANIFLDTGADLTLLLTSKFILESAILLNKRKPRIIKAQGMGGKKPMAITLIKKLKIGPYRFHNVPVYLLDDEFNLTQNLTTNGLVGSELLSGFNLIFNYQNNELHLLPNTHFENPFDYSYLGMSLYYIDGKIIIDDLIPASPAFNAGFKKEDIIISINNNSSNNITSYKNILHTSGKRLKIWITRNGIPILLRLKVGKIS